MEMEGLAMTVRLLSGVGIIGAVWLILHPRTRLDPNVILGVLLASILSLLCLLLT